jgi:hypothetical protein
MKEQLLAIEPDGTLIAIYDDDLTSLFDGKTTITRASHVEPHPDGGWIADMSPICDELGIPREVLGPAPLRELALQLERGWLEANLF